MSEKRPARVRNAQMKPAVRRTTAIVPPLLCEIDPGQVEGMVSSARVDIYGVLRSTLYPSDHGIRGPQTEAIEGVLRNLINEAVGLTTLRNVGSVSTASEMEV